MRQSIPQRTILTCLLIRLFRHRPLNAYLNWLNFLLPGSPGLFSRRGGNGERTERHREPLRERRQECQLFHNKGEKHQTASCLYFLTLPIREIQEMHPLTPSFFFFLRWVLFCATAKRPSHYLCSTACTQQTGPDRSQRTAKLRSTCWRPAQIHRFALLCFFAYWRSSHFQVSRMQLPLEITPSLLSQLTPQSPPWSTVTRAPKTSFDCCVCWGHRHHFTGYIEKQFVIQISPWIYLVFHFSISMANPAPWVPFLPFL